MSRLVFLDACVLVPQRLSSLLLTMAEHGLFEPRWSDKVLKETERALVRRLGLSPTQASRRIGAMRGAFPEASVVGFETLEPGLRCDPKDRHVLAAAISGGVDDLLTANLRHFPDEACAPYGLAARHPGELLLELLFDNGPACRRAIVHEADRLRAPQLTVRELLASLTRVAPTFAHTAWNLFDELDEVPTEFPVLVVADEAKTPFGAFERQPDPTDPLHVAFAWSRALAQRDSELQLLEALTWHSPAWSDWRWADELMADRAFASRVYEAVDDESGQVAFVRLVPAVAQTSRVDAAFVVRGGSFLVMKRLDDGAWCVWGLGEEMVAAQDVIDG